MKLFNFGENLRQIRIHKGVSQEAMALKMDITQTKYSRIERGIILPDKNFIDKAAAFLRIEPALLTPTGWDQQVRTSNIACTLTPVGKYTYRILLALTAWEFASGLSDGYGLMSDAAKVAVGVVIAILGVIFWRWTEKAVESR